MSEFTTPLDGLSVIELGHVVAAPYATLMLADLGADVVKVEHPGHGDHMRVAGDTGRAIFAAMNRNKLSVALDLRDADDYESLLGLVSEADVVVENFAPGAMASLGLDYETLRQENPGLIYVSIKGYDAAGPYAERPATDPIVQAMSGLMSVTGHADRPPARAGTSIVDIATAQNAVIAVLLALQSRLVTGEGRYVSVPLFRTSVSLMAYWLAYVQMFDRLPQRMGASHSLYAPYNVYPTADGSVFIGATSDAHWRALKGVVGLSMGYDDREERLQHRDEIDDALVAALTDRRCTELVDALLSVDVPAAPVNDLGDVVSDPHLAATDALTEIDTDDATGVRVPWTIPWTRPTAHARDPPELGADTAVVLGSRGSRTDLT
jgi:itaconate CoA-transferase